MQICSDRHMPICYESSSYCPVCISRVRIAEVEHTLALRDEKITRLEGTIAQLEDRLENIRQDRMEARSRE